jgi:membrane protein required for colicin V production
MTWLDWLLVAVLGLSMLIGAWRGLMREMFALAGWIAAFVAAALLAAEGALFIPESVATLQVRTVAAGVAIFLVVLVAASVAGLLVSKLLRVAGLGVADRTLGGAFGFARGALICALAVFAAGMTTVPREPFWRQAALTAPLETAVIAAKPYLPPALAERLKYDR